MREKALNEYAKVGPSPSVDGNALAPDDCDQGQDLMAFAGYPVIISCDGTPQHGTTHQGYEHIGIHVPELTPPPELNAEFRSMVRIFSPSSSPLHSLTTTPDAVMDLGRPVGLQGSALTWIPAECTAPSLDSYGNAYGDIGRGAYAPAEKDAVNQWDAFSMSALLLDVGIPSGSSHNNFR